MSENCRRPVSRRKYLSTAAVVSGLAVAGCLGDDDDDPAPGDDADDDDDAAPADDGDDDTPDIEPGDKEASEEVEIDLWLSVGGDNLDLLQEMADDFAADSDTITVNVTEQGNYSEVYNQTIQSVRADEAPAIVHLNAVETLSAWAADAIIPVSDLIGDIIDPDEFLDAAVAYYMREGDLLGLPFAMSTVTAQYNVSAFEEAGIPSHPDDVELTTYDDWWQASEEVEDAGAVPHGVTWPTLAWFWESYYAMNGQVVVNNDNGRAEPATEGRFDSDVGEDLYSWFYDMYDEEHYLFSDSWGDARDALLNEEAAVMIDSSSNLRAMVEGADANGFEHGVCPVPSATEDDRHGLIIGGGSLFVPRGVEGPQAEAAGEFLAWLAQPEQQARWHMETGYYPVSEEAADLAEDQGFYEDFPGFRRAFDQLVETEDIPATQGILAITHRQIRNNIDDGVDRLLGGDPVESMLASTNDDITSSLQDGLLDDPR